MVSAAVTAMPVMAPGSGSVTLSRPLGGGLRSTSALTSVPTAPLGGPASSATGSRATLVSTSAGAALATVTVSALPPLQALFASSLSATTAPGSAAHVPPLRGLV